MSLFFVTTVGMILCVIVILPESRSLQVSDRKEDDSSLCQLRKDCTLLELLRNKADVANLKPKKRICQLADEASLIPSSFVCGNTGSGIKDLLKSPDTIIDTMCVCELKRSCALMALAINAQDPHYHTMQDICLLADRERQLVGDITCKPIEKNESENKEGSEKQDGQITSDPESQDRGPDLSRALYFDDCSEIYIAQATFGSISSGVYDIRPVDSDEFEVYCDMTTDGGGWTVIQARFDGSIDFNRRYNAYKYGFGPASGEHWLGLERMYKITAQNTYELYVELVDWSNVEKYAKYSSFSVGSSLTYYTLGIDGYSGTAGDAFYSSSTSSYNMNGARFSARDRDNDQNTPSSCTNERNTNGAWWWQFCGYVSLNGAYLRPSDITPDSGYGIWWQNFGGSYSYYLKESKMMIRPADFFTKK